jgi:DNA-binding response OmpR family regulator
MDGFDRPTILIVDSDPAARASLELLLKKSGYSAEAAPDNSKAQHILRRTDMNAVVAAAVMSDSDGFSLLIEIKQQFPGIAVIMIADRTDTYRIKDALMMGADDYITKPFQHHEVVVIIERALRRLELSRRRNPQQTG